MNKKLNITAVEYQHKVRQQAKARTERFRREQEKRGYKNLTVYLSEQFRAELKRLSDENGLNRQDAMDYIFGIYQQNIIDCVTSNVTETNNKSIEAPANTWSEAKHAPIKEKKLVYRPIKETQTEIPAPKPDQNMELPDYLVNVKSDISVEKRHKIILRLAEDFPGRKNAQIRIDLLNDAEILLGGRPWQNTKQFADQLSIARRWIKKQENKK